MIQFQEQIIALAVSAVSLAVMLLLMRRESRKRHDIDATIYDRRRDRP